MQPWGNGTHAVRLGVVDADGRETLTAPFTVRLDYEAPPAPTVGVGGGAAWSAAASRSVSWTIPAETDRAPISAVEVQRCDSQARATT